MSGACYDRIIYKSGKTVKNIVRPAKGYRPRAMYSGTTFCSLALRPVSKPFVYKTVNDKRRRHGGAIEIIVNYPLAGMSENTMERPKDHR